jgi:uncharacterized protein (TIGR02145 family)
MKLFKVFFTAALLAAVGVQAQKAWDEKIDSEWYWDNQEQTEFTISTAAQLAGLAQLVNGGNNFSGKTIKLSANIMLNDTANWKKWSETKPTNAWTPIGSHTDENNSRPFSGTFDGGGKVISGVYVNSSDDYKGFFGYVVSGATIKNLGIAASYVNGRYYVGSLVGWNSGTITDCYVAGYVMSSNWHGSGSYVGGLAGSNKGTITNCYATVEMSRGDFIGGLVGSNEGGTITDSYAAGNVEGSPAGGLVGSNEGGTITNSFATGDVKGSIAGGLVGKNDSYDKPNSTITNSYAIGKVSGEYSTGGLVGENNGTITDSYATGNVSGRKSVGGLVGENNGTITDSYATGNVNGSTAGGLAGSNNEKGIIGNSYAMGNVSGGTYSYYYVGGLAGSNVGGTITNCYATGNVWNSGGENTGGLVGSNRVYDKKGIIENSYAMGNVSSSGEYSGGLAGSNSATITNSYAMGSVAGSTSGGLVGRNWNNLYGGEGTVENSYSAGNVKGTTSTNGGLVGENGKGTIANSYYDRQASGQSDIVNKGEPKSTAQMKQQATFNGWDFGKIWKIDEKNNGYPYLQSSEKSLPVKYKYPRVQQGQVLTDKRDGKKYKTVVINTQTWMAENLNYNTNGSKCYGEGEKGWDGKKPRYSTKETQNFCTKYGRLYDWKTAIKACPNGWHLPTRKEWEELDGYADMYLDGADKYLKATSGWYKGRENGRDVDRNGTDDFGFAALPGGIGSAGGSFSHADDFGYWWSNSETSSFNAYIRGIYYNSGHVSYGYNDKSYLYSVRCIQD